MLPFTQKKYDKNIYPTFVDKGPAVNGKGNLISLDEKTWEEVQNQDKNFVISAVVTSEEGTLLKDMTDNTAFPVITGYNIYKNYIKLASVPASVLQYTNKNVKPGIYNYSVSALYDKNESSLATASTDIQVSIENITAINKVNIAPTAFREQVRIINYQQVKSVEIYASDGKMVQKTDYPSEWIHTSTISQGIYFFRIYTNKEVKTIRGIKQ
ncbi:MAG: T9SS type A sorting domain-containing protein [Parabacteroides sp.]|nr:T9SS type A sorting domain-containing protein [Parabacteroides sp.]